MKHRSFTALRRLALLLVPTAALGTASACDKSTKGAPVGPVNTSPTTTTTAPNPNPSDGGPGGQRPAITPDNWRGYLQVQIEDTPDPTDNDVTISADGYVVDKPQTDEEKAIHKAEFDGFMFRRGNVPRGTCVARGSAPPPPPNGKPRFADVGDVKVSRDGSDILTLARGQEGNLQYAQDKFPRPTAPIGVGLSLKYWVSDLGIRATLGSPEFTSDPAADEDERIKVDLGTRLLFNFARANDTNMYASATLSTVTPGGPYYTCYANEAGVITIEPNILSEFHELGEGVDFMLGIEHFFTDYFAVTNNSGIGDAMSLGDPQYLPLVVTWGTSFHFYF